VLSAVRVDGGRHALRVIAAIATCAAAWTLPTWACNAVLLGVGIAIGLRIGLTFGREAR
jgi:hypothetical protein